MSCLYKCIIKNQKKGGYLWLATLKSPVLCPVSMFSFYVQTMTSLYVQVLYRDYEFKYIPTKIGTSAVYELNIKNMEDFFPVPDVNLLVLTTPLKDGAIYFC